MLALSNRARVLHSQLCRLHSACKNGPAWGVVQAAAAPWRWNANVIQTDHHFSCMTFTHIFFFLAMGVGGNFVKSPHGVATRVTFKKTLTRNLMDFCTLQKATPPKKASICATLHLNTTSPSLSSLFCTTCASAIVSHYGSLVQLLSARLYYSSALPFWSVQNVWGFFSTLNKCNMKFWGGSLSLPRHAKKAKEKIGTKGEGEICRDHWSCSWRLSVKCFSVLVGNSSFIAFHTGRGRVQAEKVLIRWACLMRSEL